MLVTTTHDEERSLLREHRSESLEFSVGEEDLTNLTRELVQTVNDRAAARRHRQAVLRELNRHHDERNVLRRVRLGRSDTRASAETAKAELAASLSHVSRS